MYRITQQQMSLYDYIPPTQGVLDPANRWVRLADAMDWDGFERTYSEKFDTRGKAALPARIALGALVIQKVYGCSDRETVELVRENPYLRYFLGLRLPMETPPFSARSMPRFRARIPAKTVQAAVRDLRTMEQPQD